MGYLFVQLSDGDACDTSGNPLCDIFSVKKDAEIAVLWSFDEEGGGKSVEEIPEF
jgi:hypothetical protein